MFERAKKIYNNMREKSVYCVKCRKGNLKAIIDNVNEEMNLFYKIECGHYYLYETSFEVKANIKWHLKNNGG